MAAWQRAFWRCSEYRFCMTVWIKEWLSLLLSRPHLCLLSLCGGQQEFPSINQKPMPGSTIADLLTSPNAEGSVEIIQKESGRKKKTKRRQASPACHRCPRIDFFPVSWRKWVRNYCLARGSTKLDSLCVCSQQSVSKANSDWLWSKHIFIQIGSFYRREWNNCPPEQEMRPFMYVQDIHPGVRRCVFFPRRFHKVHGVGSYWDEKPAAVFPHLLRSRSANNTPARITNETTGCLIPPAELQSRDVQPHWKKRFTPNLNRQKLKCAQRLKMWFFSIFFNVLLWQRITLSRISSPPSSDCHFLPCRGATCPTLPLLD